MSTYSSKTIPNIDEVKFVLVDYIIFILFMVISITLGLYTAFKNKNQSTQVYLVGGKSLPVVPVTFSIIGGSISAISILGNSTEVYLYGSQIALNLLGAFWGVLIFKNLILPVLYPLDIISLYEYLELRFGSVLLRKFAVLLGFISNFFFLGACLYSPSLALSSVTNITPTTSVVVVGLICSIYTALGGVTAVVYTDVFQTTTMLLGVISVIIVGCNNYGGVDGIRKIAMNADRLNMFNFDFNPLVRHTFWSVQILGIYFIIGSNGLQQSQFQRFISVNSLKKSKQVATLFYPGLFILWTVFYFSGLVAYATYEHCDPITSGRIDKPDQIIPFLVADTLRDFPGLCGLFVAGIYGGVLSSLSSVTNGIACNLWEDFLKDTEYFKKMSDKNSTKIVQLLSFLGGIITIGMAILMEHLGTIFQAVYTISGALSGPVIGLFISGLFGPWISFKGAVSGFIVSLTLNLWLFIGQFITGAGQEEPLPLYVDGCPESQNKTEIYQESTYYSSSDEKGFYDLSYCYIGMMGVLVVFIIGSLVSLITGAVKPKDVEERLIYKKSFQIYNFLYNKITKT